VAFPCAKNDFSCLKAGEFSFFMAGRKKQFRLSQPPHAETLQLSGQVCKNGQGKRSYRGVNRRAADDFGLFISISEVFEITPWGVVHGELHFASAIFTVFGANTWTNVSKKFW